MASTINETLVGYAVWTTDFAGNAIDVLFASNVNLIVGATSDIVSVRIGPPVLTATPNTPAVAAFSATTPSVSDPWRLATVNSGNINPLYKICVDLEQNDTAVTGIVHAVTRLDDCTWRLNFYSRTVAAAVLIAAATDDFTAKVSIYQVGIV